MVTPRSVPKPSPPTPSAAQSPTTDGLSWYVVPPSVKQLLVQATTHWDDPTVANNCIHQALDLAPNHPDVLVSAYRYFFYTHNDPLALQVATRVLDGVRQREQLPDRWDDLKPVLRDRADDPAIRLYINAYAASGLIRARLGEVELAKQIATQVSEIEFQNEFGGNVVRQILEHPDDDDADDDH